MSKYIPADKLIAEIERRKKELFEIGGDTFENKWACGSLDNIKAFVISLQQEQPEVDLEKEIELAIPQPYSFLEVGTFNAESVYSREQMVAFARHFYELGLNNKK